jgi:GLPGLI family protein
MIKNLKLSLVALLCLGYAFTANAQKTIKEGAIVYNVEYDLPPEQQAMAAMLPTSYKVNFKGDYSVFKMDLGMFSTEVIYNNATKETLSLTEVPMQNKKIAMKMNAEQSKKMQEMQNGEKDFEVKTTTETKQIAGYNCTKFILNDKISGESAEVWATTELNIPANSLTSSFKDIVGVPVQFNTNAQGMKTKMTLKEAKEEVVTDINMNIPAGYELMTFEDLLKQMGG